MIVRKSTQSDLEAIEKIYEHARKEMKKNNNPHQWKDTEPSIDKIINDINLGNHHILENNGEICGVFAMIYEKDPTYSYIEGNWLNDEDYVTIHRIASNNLYKGVFDAVIAYAFAHSDNVRIDTHKDNSIMRHLIEKNGFTYCGIIYLANGEPRLAFHKKNIK